MPFWIVAAVDTTAGKQGPWWHDGCCFKNCAGQPTSSIIETAMLWAWKTSAPLLRQSQGCRLQSSQPLRLKGQNEQGRCFEREVPAACLREWFACAIPCTHEGQKKFWDFSHFFPKMKPLRMYPRCEGSEAHPLSRKPGHGSGVILKAMVSLALHVIFTNKSRNIARPGRDAWDALGAKTHSGYQAGFFLWNWTGEGRSTSLVGSDPLALSNKHRMVEYWNCIASRRVACLFPVPWDLKVLL